MNKKTKFAWIFLLAILTSSCVNYKKVPYLQKDAKRQVTAQVSKFDAKIMPNDLLTITVNTADREAAMPFNLVYPTGGTSISSSLGENALQKYLVDSQGYINFPTVGMLRVEGMTRREAESLILEKISSNFKELPIVIVSFSDYKVSVVGEVARPGTFTIANEKVNVLQALSLAGDMTIYGERDNVQIIREHANGEKEVIYINLNDRSLLDSPNYYLQQNDVLYVVPNKTKARGADIGAATTLTFSSVSILISVTNLVLNVIRLNDK